MNIPNVKIEPHKLYTLQEIISRKFIHGVNSYSTLYSMVTVVSVEDGKRAPVEQTTLSTIKPEVL